MIKHTPHPPGDTPTMVIPHEDWPVPTSLGPSSCPYVVRYWKTPQRYSPMQATMRAWTLQRTPDTPDEIWMLEHEAVYTQGIAGRACHVLASSDNPLPHPLVQSDRGGQVTFHNQGQLICYPLVNLTRHQLGLHNWILLLAKSFQNVLHTYGVQADYRPETPGLYVRDLKIASMGLRVRQGCSYHGIALNVRNALTPFNRIHPCGLSDQRMTSLIQEGIDIDLWLVAQHAADLLCQQLAPLQH